MWLRCLRGNGEGERTAAGGVLLEIFVDDHASFDLAWSELVVVEDHEFVVQLKIISRAPITGLGDRAEVVGRDVANQALSTSVALISLRLP